MRAFPIEWILLKSVGELNFSSWQGGGFILGTRRARRAGKAEGLRREKGTGGGSLSASNALPAFVRSEWKNEQSFESQPLLQEAG